MTISSEESSTIARARLENGHWIEQLLPAHLRGVAALAERFAQAFGAGGLGHLSGLWHDLGKYAPDWQRYIRAAVGMNNPEAEDAHLEDDNPRRKGPDHSAAGALYAIKTLGPTGQILAQLIAAHHAGLYDAMALEHRLAKSDTQQRLTEARTGDIPSDILNAHRTTSTAFDKAPPSDPTPGALALWLRMLFSGLIDADRLDSEAFGDASRAGARRAEFPELSALQPDFDRFMARFAQDTPVRRLRADILNNCRTAALQSPGLFTLTVPTGGGKTLGSLAFALEHAAHNHLKRVIYVIPYTSIIEQTADVFRSISPAFAGAVVEHHSNAEDDSDSRKLTPRESERLRLATENWDAPVIVTTSVQFFESLFAAQTSRCRKLHNICESVVVIDEAQLLPPTFLQPIVDALNLLTRHYKTSIVLSTATQPALAGTQRFGASFRGLDPSREIIANVERLYRELKRVEIHLPEDFNVRTSWADLAERLSAEGDVLVIVNRRAEARDLFHRLPKGGLHLSALMCGAHRSDVIAEIKRRLEARRTDPNLPPVRVVATQLVEAGVDLDFPAVYRAFAGLDSIAQAAGRCNREGRLQRGQVHVFVGEKDAPAGTLRMAETAAKEVLHGHNGDALDRGLFEPYFRRFYEQQDRDAKTIVDKLEPHRPSFGITGFKQAAEAFKLIDNDETGYRSVLVPYCRNADDNTFDKLTGTLRRDGPARWLLRKLQRYSVSLPPHEFEALRDRGDIEEIVPDFWMVRSVAQYRGDLGLCVDAGAHDAAHLNQ